MTQVALATKLDSTRMPIFSNYEASSDVLVTEPQ